MLSSSRAYFHVSRAMLVFDERKNSRRIRCTYKNTILTLLKKYIEK
jgi:hypothetical protein